MSNPRRMSTTEWGLLAVLSLLWGGSFLFSKVALTDLPPLTLVLARTVVASLALFAYLRLRGLALPRSSHTWSAFFCMGLLNCLVPFTLIFWSLHVISSGLASILNATTPVFSILVARAVSRDETLSLPKLAGIALGIAGVAVLLGGPAAWGTGSGLWGILACLGATTCYGLANTYGRRFKRLGVHPTVAAFGQIAATALMALPLALLVDRPWHLHAPSLATWGALFGLALLSTALAYIIFFRLIATVGATNISLVTLLIPVSAILLARLVLGERLAPSQYAGMALIGLGLLTLNGRILPRR